MDFKCSDWPIVTKSFNLKKYFNHLILRIILSLVQSLEAAVRAGSSKQPLINRLKATLGKVCAIKNKQEDVKVSSECGNKILETLSG